MQRECQREYAEDEETRGGGLMMMFWLHPGQARSSTPAGGASGRCTLKPVPGLLQCSSGAVPALGLDGGAWLGELAYLSHRIGSHEWWLGAKVAEIRWLDPGQAADGSPIPAG